MKEEYPDIVSAGFSEPPDEMERADCGKCEMPIHLVNDTYFVDCQGHDFLCLSCYTKIGGNNDC